STSRSQRGRRQRPLSNRSSARRSLPVDGDPSVTPCVKRLLIANVLMFLVELAVPSVTSALLLMPAAVLYRPWTNVTYMFLHDPNSIGHILFNMLGLFFFGPRVEDRLGPNRFITLD